MRDGDMVNIETTIIAMIDGGIDLAQTIKAIFADRYRPIDIDKLTIAPRPIVA